MASSSGGEGSWQWVPKDSLIVPKDPAKGTRGRAIRLLDDLLSDGAGGLDVADLLKAAAEKAATLRKEEIVNAEARRKEAERVEAERIETEKREAAAAAKAAREAEKELARAEKAADANARAAAVKQLEELAAAERARKRAEAEAAKARKKAEAEAERERMTLEKEKAREEASADKARREAIQEERRQAEQAERERRQTEAEAKRQAESEEKAKRKAAEKVEKERIAAEKLERDQYAAELAAKRKAAEAVERRDQQTRARMEEEERQRRKSMADIERKTLEAAEKTAKEAERAQKKADAAARRAEQSMQQAAGGAPAAEEGTAHEKAMADMAERELAAATAARAAGLDNAIDTDAARAKNERQMKEQSPKSSPKSSPRSSAGQTAAQRLERAQSRLSFLGRGSFNAPKDDDDGDQPKVKHKLMSVGGTAVASKDAADKAERRASFKAKQQQASEVKAAEEAQRAGLATQSVGKALAGWGRGGVKAAEFSGVCGFTADCLALAKDGETLVSIGGDGDGKHVSVYSASTAEVVGTLEGHKDHVCSVAIRGDLIASGSRDKTIRLWESSGGFEAITTLKGCEDLIYGLALRENCDILLSGEGSKTGGKTRLWALSGGARKHTITATYGEHSGPVWGVAIGEKLVVSASHDGKAKVWPLHPPTVGEGTPSLATLPHPSSVYSCSVDRELLATGCGDRNVRLWSLDSFKCLRTLQHGSGGVIKPVFSVRMLGGIVVSGGEDTTVHVWSLASDASTTEPVTTLSHGATVRGLAISQKGMIASAGGNLKKLLVWEQAAA